MLNAVLFPIGIGIMYWPAIICSWEWFPNRKGMISGLIIGAFGLGAFIFGFITTAITNPDNVKPGIPIGPGPITKDNLFPIDVAEKVPYMMNFCLCIWVVMCLLACFTVTRNPEYGNQENAQKVESNEIKDDEDVVDKKTTADAVEEVPAGIGYYEAFTSIRFWY